ncbi:hypothetical protein A6V39_03150 [Candidatus Mycoplasma haematobovis]|uniref:Uncharacterized protein n=1 Tax=Candidatus Mycoplasma haematobovis TaxID=432608 RepID=A0A1A9QEM6_9MOLU|nr:hypothetical protein [Candidatus Mycoplasma haematobovis]OAL10406.1 hypothetical protein A6V39_03150 [Candidatus Mycoplasma haematobovis]
MSDKSRLLDLISQREIMCSEPLEYEKVYQWLEELHYLLGRIDFSSSVASKIRRAIDEVFFNTDKCLLAEKIIQIKAKLFVFEKYEAEKLRDN